MTASEAPGRAPAAEPTPLDRILDLAVYVPLGLVLAARDVLPRLAEAGRRQLGPQLTAARVVGRLAVDQGTRRAGEAIRRLGARGEAPLGGRHGRPRPASGFPASATPSERAAADTVVQTGAEGGPTAVPHAPATSAADPADLDPADLDPADLDPAELAIPGYDTLSASQVVQRLPGLSSDELEAVRSYELAGRGRKTILLKVAQLRQTS